MDRLEGRSGSRRCSAFGLLLATDYGLLTNDDSAFFLSISLALVHPSEIHLLEAETLKQFHGGLIALDALHFDQAKILFLHIAEKIHHQEFGHALAADVLASDEIHDSH